MNQEISLFDYNIHVGDVLDNFVTYIKEQDYSQIILLVDDNTRKDCLPLFIEHFKEECVVLNIPAGEEHKNIETCKVLWDNLMNTEATRKAVFLNLGGGVIGDMGGFVASTFKRGMDFIQMPTTLLSQIDASIGGKLGVDFMGLKNMIGLFNDPKAVFIVPEFLKTLPERELRSGFSEMIKHGLIGDEDLWQKVKKIENLNEVVWDDLIIQSLQVKKDVVLKDPREGGFRKVLNFGHTIGHAIESWAMDLEEPLLHGEAIAIGMICETYLSREILELDVMVLHEVNDRILSLFPKVNIPESAFEYLIKLMHQDKKNFDAAILFSLIKAISLTEINIEIEEHKIIECLEYYNNL